MYQMTDNHPDGITVSPAGVIYGHYLIFHLIFHGPHLTVPLLEKLERPLSPSRPRHQLTKDIPFQWQVIAAK